MPPSVFPTDIQSLWLTSWLSGRTKRSTGGGIGIGLGIGGIGGIGGTGGHEKCSVNVYTLQQAHKFPLQLDAGNCSLDCHQELDRIRHRHPSSPVKSRQKSTPSSAPAGEIYETKFIESSMGKHDARGTPLPKKQSQSAGSNKNLN